MGKQLVTWRHEVHTAIVFFQDGADLVVGEIGRKESLLREENGDLR
jgi:hypothetical protein